MQKDQLAKFEHFYIGALPGEKKMPDAKNEYNFIF